ncbi:ABC transporter permease [Gordonia sputi]|uniref:ABC transporter permease n=1 Tax=Gordonia sputi TaxID=36823 RepID=UPI0036A56183
MLQTEAEPLSFGAKYRRLLLAVVLLGALTQLGLGAFYLGVGHSPSPRNVPIGIVGPEQQTHKLTAAVEAEGKFDARSYESMDSLRAAIVDREVDGGLEITQQGIVPVVASAGGALPATALKAVASEANVSNQLPQTLAVDVVKLSEDDINGASIGYILQVISLGGSIASLGLGRLMPRVPQSLRRGFGHVAALVAYAAVSAGIVLLFSWFYGVGSSADQWRLFGTYTLISLAIAGSTAGLVTLFGPIGSLAGGFYFLVGATLSGASIPWNFMPTFWAKLGEWLPTGGGAQLIRNSLYFPEAGSGTALLCLGLYAGLGTVTVLIWNMLGNRSSRTSAVDVDILYPITHEHHHQDGDHEHRHEAGESATS